MENRNTLTFLSPLGFIEIKGDEEQISEVSFAETNNPSQSSVPALLHQCKEQLQEYFSAKRKIFDLPLKMDGTFFQQSVWRELMTIRYGNTISYLQLAIKTGDEKSVRAVGSANGKNPVAIIVPCHRVIGANGKLVGYGGELWRKQWLLEHEEKNERGVLRLF
ncbi:MAG: methylated-DNA--[protein]-cysteine S-methyltransferase [Chitinophagales bacterium]|nr:methylated-DNA--[protein]-cysteine S-methyltransferase [Chitinophagales bacterium]